MSEFQPHYREQYTTGPFLLFRHHISVEELYFWILEQAGKLGARISTEATRRGGFVWESEQGKKIFRLSLQHARWPRLRSDAEKPEKSTTVVLAGSRSDSIFISKGQIEWKDAEIVELKAALKNLGVEFF